MKCHFKLRFSKTATVCLRKLYPFELVTSEVGIDHFAKILRSQMHFCHIVIQAKELFRRVIFVKILYVEMILARIHSMEKICADILCSVRNVLTALSWQKKSIIGFFVSLGEINDPILDSPKETHPKHVIQFNTKLN